MSNNRVYQISIQMKQISMVCSHPITADGSRPSPLHLAEAQIVLSKRNCLSSVFTETTDSSLDAISVVIRDGAKVEIDSFVRSRRFDALNNSSK